MIWPGILLCLANSALFSGLTLGYFGLSRLRLEVLAEAGDADARGILALRRDANLLLATLLWGNVSVNVLLTLLTDSVLSGVAAFSFSTFGITIFGEILPQAFFARHGLKAGARLLPLISLYRLVLYPLAKPTALLLDRWLGREGIVFFQEDEIKLLLRKHVDSSASDVGRVEGLGAINFLELDDIPAEREGEPLHPQSVLALPQSGGRPAFPSYRSSPEDPFLKAVHRSGKKWVVLTGPAGEPLAVLNAHRFLQDALMSAVPPDPARYSHRPVIAAAPGVSLGALIRQLHVEPVSREDDVIDQDLILYWGPGKRIITGADLFGRLLRGLVRTSGAGR